MKGYPACVVMDLSPGATYTFTVVATNTAGTTPASQPSAPITPTTCDGTYGSPAAPTVTMTVVNASSFADDEVYVALTGQNAATSGPQWGATPCGMVNGSMPLTRLTKAAEDHTYTFQLGQNIGAGLLWVSLGQPVTSGLPVVQPSLDTAQYRFANVEFAFPGQGDITNVNQFSFPVDIATFATPPPSGTSPGTTAARTPIKATTYTGNTCAIVSDLQKAVDGASSTYPSPGPAGSTTVPAPPGTSPTGTGTSTTSTAKTSTSSTAPPPPATVADWSHIQVNDAAGRFVRVVAPMQRTKQPYQNGANPYYQGWPSMLPYLESLKGTTIEVKGLFTPAADQPYVGQTGWYSYKGTFDSVTGDLTLKGTFDSVTGDLTLKGTIRSPLDKGPGVDGVAGDDIVVRMLTKHPDSSRNPGYDGLATGIYDQNSQYWVGRQPRNGFADMIQTLTLSSATGGTFTLTYGGATTTPLAHDASAADVQKALLALGNLNSGDVTVTGSAGGPYTFAFGGTLLGTIVNEVAADGSKLTGPSGKTPTAAMATQADPAAPNDAYNSVYRDLTSAFIYGYWGGKYGNDNSKFWGKPFTPPDAPDGGQPSFEAARTNPKENFLAYSIYSKVMFEHSDAYNIPYGENYGSGAPSRPSPLLDVPAGGEWRMTIRDDVPRDTGVCPS